MGRYRVMGERKMDADENSTCTSADDGTEDFGDNPTRDTLTEGLISLLKPTVDNLENSIKHTRQSQIELKSQIESLSLELNTISKNQQCPIDLESYIKKLLDARRRITTINSVLQNAQDRLNKIHQLSTKEIVRIQTVDSPASDGRH